MTNTALQLLFLCQGSELLVNHFPVLIDTNKGPNGTIVGHMAKSNPQWKAWGQQTKLICIFHGPNHYISPNWYQNSLNVPTWNYSVVHMTGRHRILESHEDIERVLAQLVHKYEKLESHPWQYELPEDFRKSLTKAIVGFEIEIDQIEAKFKLSQNREDEDRESAILALSSKSNPSSQAMSNLMKEHWPERYASKKVWSLARLNSVEKQKCEQILRNLPNWFGIETAIQNYVQDIASMETWGVWTNEELVGFVTLRFHNEHTAEIQVMGLLEAYHRLGLGTALVKKAEEAALLKGCGYLSVKTLSQAHPDPFYAKTRKFYLACGFRPVEEFKTLWGESNPCLLMIKTITRDY